MRSRGRRAAPRTVVAGAATVLLVAGTTVLGGGTASADPELVSARGEAAALAERIEDLEQRAAAATEDYNAIADELARTSSASIVAADRRDALDSLEEAQQRASTARISALYRAGGELGLYATVLEGGSPNDVVARVRVVRDIVDADHRDLVGARRHLADAAAAEAGAERLYRERRVLADRAERARSRVTRLLAERKERLEAVSATVRRLAAEEQEAARRAAEAAAAVTLADLGLDTGAAPGNPYASAAIEAAVAQVGDPYVWAATGPDSFDCSGLVMWSYARAGLALPRTSRQQWFSGPRVELDGLLPGDLVFWARSTSDPSTIHHVAMYLGGGRMVEAPYTGANVRVVPLRLGAGYIGAVRPGLGR